MSFVFPTFLYALFALSIPIIIHLFNFRKYKKVYFTNVKFLRELKQESQSKSRLKELLILLSRILAIMCLVLAFAQPVLVDKTAKIKTGDKAIGIYIDNSFSMEGINKNGTLLNDAKKRALEIVNAFGSADRFVILTNDFEGKHQRLLSKEEIVDAINEIKISAAVKPLSLVVKRQNDFLKTSKAKDLRQFLISDFQKSVSDFKNLKADTLISSTLISLAANNNNNLYIDTCWFETPVQQKGIIQKLNIRVWNKSNQPVENGTIKLFINKQQIGIASYNAEPNSKAETKMTFECKTEGFNFCSLKIDDYPIVFDDELFFTFNSKLNISALVINGTNAKTGTHFKTLMQNDSLFSFHENNEQSVDYALFGNSNLIVLNEIENFSSGMIAELTKYVNNGGYLAIIPAAKANQQNYNDFYKTFNLPLISGLDTAKLKVEKTDFKTGFYEGVFDKIDERIDLPIVRKHYTLNMSSKNNMNPVLKLINSETWIGELPIKNSKIYIFASALDESFTNFCKHALFVPTFYKMAINSLKPLPLYYYAQTNSVISLNALKEKSEEPIHLTEINNKFDVIPEIRVNDNHLNVYTQNQITAPGFYKLTHKGVALQS
ncbi:MAG TPA: BatA domain-containing protein, partial [Bacteroidia bacterium]|nr:BatA domain-containing protein [Bacteroidia bacterium]